MMSAPMFDFGILDVTIAPGQARTVFGDPVRLLHPAIDVVRTSGPRWWWRLRMRAAEALDIPIVGPFELRLQPPDGPVTFHGTTAELADDPHPGRNRA